MRPLVSNQAHKVSRYITFLTRLKISEPYSAPSTATAGGRHCPARVFCLKNSQIDTKANVGGDGQARDQWLP